MVDLPLFSELRGTERILLAGAGGGFDIFCGLPLYFALKKLGKAVFLANLSFSTLPAGPLRRSPSLLEVTAETEMPSEYFPERHLASWFRERGDEVSIYCFERTGCIPLTEAYRTLVDDLNLDAVVLIDGGTDSLMRGDEAGLGTPHEDIASIAAVDQLELETKLLVCLGFGVDAYHGVCHAQFLEGVSDVIKAGGFLGAFSLLKQME